MIFPPTGIDSNVLARFLVKNDPQHALINQAVGLLLSAQAELFTTFQNMAECWNVLTRPVGNNGFGLMPSQAEQGIVSLEKFIDVLTETPVAYRHWLRLVGQEKVIGKQVHDARIASVLFTSGVTHLLTFNGKDFDRFGITVVTPDDIVARAAQNTGNES